jgi:hypothetical protein
MRRLLIKVALSVIAFIVGISLIAGALAITGHISHGKPTISHITTTQNP